MKFTIDHLLAVVLLLTSIQVESQVFDDFSDGDFTSDPIWSGDVSEFEVDGQFRLHLLAPPETDESHLSTPSETIDNAQWDISLTMDFNPSSGNRAYIYLVSDQADLESDLNGYFVMVGNTADEVSLYRQDGSSITKIIDGLDDLVDIPDVNIAIRVTRDDSGNWELFSDLNITGTYTSEGTSFDETYTSSSYFGVLCDYSPTRSELFWFDDVSVTGDGFIDETPPSLTNILVVDENSLSLSFNEDLDPLSAESTNNYLVLPATNPNTAELNGNMVILDFANDFEENTALTLQIESVQDLAGNVIETTTQEFSYVLLGNGLSGEVVINELMSDPNPSIGLPETEYIELHNTSDSAFDLLGWNIQNSGIDEFLESHILLPGEFVIICDDSFFSVFSALGPTLAVSSLTALSNSGDDLRLFNANGGLIDEVIYDISWYGGGPFDEGGYSLERKNPTLPCDNASNWGPSADSEGGTPGAQNSNFISEDVEAPMVNSLEIMADDSLKLIFTEGMDELSLILGTYSLDVSNSIVPEPIADIQEVILVIQPPLEEGNAYQLAIMGLLDCTGNELVDTTLTFIIPDMAEIGDVQINEIMADPTPSIALPEVEYVELFNASDRTFNLSGWIFRNTVTDRVLSDQLMGPGDHLILCDEDDASLLAQFGTVLPIPSFSGLTNDGDDLYLIDDEGIIIDQVIYSSAWYNDSNRDDGGYSLERINPELPCSDQKNWRASIAQQGGTPGQVNSVLDTSPDITSPEVVGLTLNGAQQIIIQFSESVELSSVDEGDIVIEPEASVIGYGQAQPDQISIDLDSPLDSGIIYSVTIVGIEDCVGNVSQIIQDFSTAVPQQFQEGDLIINEVLFNPRTGGFDFVEIYNRSERALSLKNWKMANRESGEIANILSITSDEILILPGEFKVITESPQNISSNYPLGRSANFVETDDLPSYGDDEGYVILVDPVIDVHDEFFYSEDYHFSLIDELDGVSLERIDYERLTNDPTNWHSAAESVGWATPGYENSQLQPANLSSESFSIDPEVFSPDNDGFQDVLNISYALEKPGYVANINIYDRDGRRVRMLVRNELLATKGTISWDGINDDGGKARIGVYVLFIEIFDQNGNVSSTKKTAVLGGRL